MKTPAPADIQRWSDEVARDPTSLAFLPLARAYRRMGQHAAAMQLCLRGLQHYPAQVEAHGLLALLYLEDGQRERAADEWSMVLRLDPDNFEALRGLGFCYLEQDQLSRARQTLERAALLRPHDPAVQEALQLLGTRQELQNQPTSAVDAAEPWAESPVTPPPAAAPLAGAPAPAVSAPTAPAVEAAPATAAPADVPLAAAPPAGAPPTASALPDPAVLFVPLQTGPVLGALLLDEHGLVLAGSLADSVGVDGEALGALLGGALEEATRTASHLRLGEWQGILLETEAALLQLAPAGAHATVLLAVERNVPAGWVLRVAAQAAELATRYLETYA